MDTKDIPARLVALHSALVAKMDGQPTISPTLSVWQTSRFSIHLYPTKGHSPLLRAKGDTAEEAFEAAEAFIAEMPDPDTRAKTEWHRKLGDVIDEGHALNLPDDVMGPIRTGSQAMAKNLLPAPEASE